jgi:Coenzyme PQQ synthesis protein D (PqqD)
MSTDRGRRRTVKLKGVRARPRLPHTLKLAPGVHVDGDGGRSVSSVLVYDGSKVQLNNSAVAILKLCDGSRDRDGVMSELMRGSNPQPLARDIIDFLDAALSRGWIVDG